MPNSLPVLIVGGFGANWQQYQPLRRTLQTISGRIVDLVPIALFDWFGVAISDDYSGILEVLDRAVSNVLRDTGVERLVLVGHSAGGVLARIYMGDRPYGRKQLIFNGFQKVATLVTLGTPHTTANAGRQGGLNQIAFVQQHYPGAYWRFIRYVTVISKGIYGLKSGTPQERGAWQSYEMLTRNGSQWGDGIIPIESALLDGARHVILEGLRHNPHSDQPWYGQDEATVHSWWRIVEEVEREPTQGMLRRA